MACAAVLEPSGDFPAWLEAQGVNAEVARAMDSELGIRDYGVLRACVGDGLVRAELLSTARDRLPFGFYAVLRQVVKALQGAEPHDAGTSHWDDAAASSPGDVTLGGLVDVLLALFSGLSRELLMSVRRLGVMDGPEMGVGVSSPPCAGVEHQDLIADEEELPSEEKSQFSNRDCPMEFRNSQVQTSVTGGGGDSEQPLDEGGNSPSTEANFSPVWQEVKVESCDGEELPCQDKFFLEEEVPLMTPAWMQRQAVATVAQARRVGNDVKKHSPRLVATVAAAATMANGEEHFPFAFERSLSLGRTNQSYTRGGGGGGGLLGLGSPPGFLIENVASMRAAAAAPPDRTAKGSGYAQYQRHAVHGRHEAEGNATVSSTRVYPAARGDAAGDDDAVAAAAAAAAPETMAPPEESRPYQCRQCGRQFARSDALRKHMRMHTGEKPYRCDVCLRPFAHYSNFKRHLRLHTGEKPYSCDVCGRAFSQCSSLKDHRHMHTGEKPYRCEVCDLHFSHRSILWSHRRTHAE